MNFLFGKKNSEPVKNDATSNAHIPNSVLPVMEDFRTTMLIDVDQSLLSTAKPVTTKPFDVTAIMPKEFKRIRGSSVVDGAQGILSTSFLKNQFLALANTAFDNHYGFVLNPCQLFILILQQIALHVNQHAEELRNQFVKESGKKKLTLEIPADPVPAEWEGIIAYFDGQIAANTIPDTQALFSMEDFSCATSLDKVAGNVLLMDVCQQFFEYKVYTRCGIPYFIMEGSVEDWQALREKAEQVIRRKTKPDFAGAWLPVLLPLLDKLRDIRAGNDRDGRVDKEFWNDFFKIGAKGGSGGYTFVNGWINSFFPLTNDKKMSRFCVPYTEKSKDADDSHRGGYDTRDFVAGIGSAPVEWTRMGVKIPLKFCCGFIGGTIKYENCLKPEIGWWVGEVDEEAVAKLEKKQSWDY
jgi:hypothetical protein